MSQMSERGDWLELAKRAARLGGEILGEGFGHVGQIDFKSSHMDLVTEFDRRSEEAIVELLQRECPEHGLLAEERGSRRGEAEYLWVVDPLDGTMNYAHAYPLFAVSIALVRAGRPEVGVVYAPILGELFTAMRGEGAFLNGHPIGVSPTPTLKKSLLGTGCPILEHIEENLPAFRAFLPLAQGIRRDGSAALDLCAVACGRFDGFWELDLKPWDVAAGWLLITEAGGRPSDFGGGAYALGDRQLLACNGRIQRQMIEVLSR